MTAKKRSAGKSKGTSVKRSRTQAEVRSESQPEMQSEPQSESRPEIQPEPSSGTLKFFIGVIIFCLLIIFAIWLTSHLRDNDTNTYNGFEFQQVQQGNLLLWSTSIQIGEQPYTIPFYFHPTETENVTMALGITDRFLAARQPERVTITFNPNERNLIVLAGVEISRILGHQYNILNIDTRSAFKEPVESNEAETPLVTCADATPTRVVISFDMGDVNLIHQDVANPNCIRLQYVTEEESIRVADRFAYGLLRIMQG